jgi:hypothetical protein
MEVPGGVGASMETDDQREAFGYNGWAAAGIDQPSQDCFIRKSDFKGLHSGENETIMS